ncbi:hypothetical protein [Escherichia coli]|nr:hypothetical protein [Escherichia coli]MEC6043684.1 hypothetical protein [Escherichia coli]
MPIQEKTTVFVFNACHADKAAAASANALHSLEVEYPMTLNDLSLLCESVAKALDVPGGVKYEITTEPVVDGGNDSNLLIVFYVQIMPDDFVMLLHRF